MKTLSRWGAQHLSYSRIIITLCHVLLVDLAIFLGLWTSAIHMDINTWMAIGLGNIFFIAYLLYPRLNADHGFFKYSYLRQKSLDFILVLSYFLMIVCGVNQFVNTGFSQSESIVEARFIVHHNNPGKDKAVDVTFKSKFKTLKKQLRIELIQLKQSLKAKNDKGGVVIVKILLVLLSVGLALALAYLIAVLACGIACSGTEGLAWVILILGWTGAIWLLVIALKAILRRRENTSSAAVS